MEMKICLWYKISYFLSSLFLMFLNIMEIFRNVPHSYIYRILSVRHTWPPQASYIRSSISSTAILASSGTLNMETYWEVSESDRCSLLKGSNRSSGLLSFFSWSKLQKATKGWTDLALCHSVLPHDFLLCHIPININWHS